MKYTAKGQRWGVDDLNRDDLESRFFKDLFARGFPAGKNKFSN